MLDNLLLTPEYLIIIGLIFGLVIGSFLNVVIYRLPLQLERSWRSDSMDFLGIEPEADKDQAEAVNLVLPASHCPKCHAVIKPWENIPVLSYLFLRGKCSVCAEPISLQYPFVELLTGLLTAFILYRFGFHGTAGAVLCFTWLLIALTGIDFNRQLLPDNLTYPLLWLGLLFNLRGVFIPLPDAVIGVVAGYLVLWSIFWLYKLMTGKEGMGHGDFKLLAALGAWLGWQKLALVILLSSVVGAAIGIAGILVLGRDRQLPIAFGPYLAIAGWVTLIWGDAIISSYLGLF